MLHVCDIGDGARSLLWGITGCLDFSTSASKSFLERALIPLSKALLDRFLSLLQRNKTWLQLDGSANTSLNKTAYSNHCAAFGLINSFSFRCSL